MNNPLDDLTWEQRFMFAFRTVLELEAELGDAQKQPFVCPRCRAKSIDPRKLAETNFRIRPRLANQKVG